MIKNKLFGKAALLPALAALALVGTGALAYAGVASASTITPSTTTASTTSAWSGTHKGKGSHGKGSGVRGTVTAVNGSDITLTGKNSTTYTVEAANSKIVKIAAVAAGTVSTTPPSPTTIVVSDIAVGDTLIVRGTVSGTSVTATSIIDGKFAGHEHSKSGTASPRVHGTITAVNGDSITVTETKKESTGTSTTAYTVDVSNAKISQRGAKGTKPTAVTVSALALGDKVGVRGTVSGTAVTATNVVMMSGTPAFVQ